ncbi:MAG: citrate (Si)-synthase [Dehalococcoidia bacterium]|nr:citrate (Si)-synthase [Dehalococcoidia bacterium]
MAKDSKVELKKGFRDVYFDRTTTSLIVGKPGKLLYRGYTIDDLAEHSTFEETSYLLLYGALPTSSQLDCFTSDLKVSRALPDEVLQVIDLIKDAHPMDVLRTAVSIMGLSDADVMDVTPEGALTKGVRMTAALPTIVAAHHRLRTGNEPIAPNGELDHAANFLYMLKGETPDPLDARLIDKDFVLHAEHGANASTFVARVAASTRADFYAALTAAIATLKGPRHGGAAEGAMRMAEEIGSVENAEAYVNAKLEARERIMGFGHAVYKDVDPRAKHLRAGAKALGEREGQTKWYSIIDAVTKTKAMQRRSRAGLNPNVDLWAGAVYSLLGIPEDLFVPLFAIGRMPGWAAHIVEQLTARDILRPRLLYNGPEDAEYVPIEDRT